jgi:hypothetical protein
LNLIHHHGRFVPAKLGQGQVNEPARSFAPLPPVPTLLYLPNPVLTVNNQYNGDHVKFRIPQHNLVTIDEVARNMNGHYDEDWKDIDSGEVKADIDLDIEANPDSQ